MIKIDIVVCDDQNEGLNLITPEVEKEFTKNKALVNVKQYINPIKLINDIENGFNFDVIFLDIEMPQLDGLTLAKKLKAKPEIIVIFVSNREDFVFDALQIHPFTFIRKRKIKKDLPFSIQEIVGVIETREKKKVKMISLDINNKIYRFNPYNVMYLKVDDKVITFFEKDTCYKIPYNLSKLMNILEEYNFIQIHRKIAVNCSYVFNVERTAVIMDNGAELSISRRKEKEFKEIFCKGAGK